MAPSFTPEQEAFIEKVAAKMFDLLEKKHIASCPYGKKLIRWSGIALGIGVAIGTFWKPAAKELLTLFGS